MRRAGRRIATAMLATGLMLVASALITVGSLAPASSAAAATPMAAPNWPLVRKGAAGPRVRTIQLLLDQRANGHLRVDGKYGPATVAAVKAFQRKHKQQVDGIVGSVTWSKLIITVKPGSHGKAVRAVQFQLRYQYAYKSVVVDGSFGPSTATAVKSFQRKYRLPPDGIVGAATWKALEVH